MDLWSEEWYSVETSSGQEGHGRTHTEPHRHREVGRLSGRGDLYPLLHEEDPSYSNGRYLAAATILGETEDAHMDTTAQYQLRRPEWPALYTLGGDDGTRFFDDFRMLSLRGLAQERPGMGDVKRERCEWKVARNSTAEAHWREACGADAGALGGNCTVRQVLQRAWCEGRYQAISNL